MSARVLLPWTDIEVPEGIEAAYYDGLGAPPPALDDVEFYVLPYDRGPEPPRLIKDLPSLRVVQALSAGVEALVPLLPAGVRLANGRGLHDLSVAEHTLALIHASQRDLPRWLAQQERREWVREHTRSLADSRVLLVGYGSIGQAIERQLLAAEAVVTRVASRARPDADVHGVAELPSLLPEADIVVLVLPDTPATPWWSTSAAARRSTRRPCSPRHEPGGSVPPSTWWPPNHCPRTIHCGRCRASS